MDEHKDCKLTEDNLWEHINTLEKALRQIEKYVENYNGDLADNVRRVAKEAIKFKL